MLTTFDGSTNTTRKNNIFLRVFVIFKYRDISSIFGSDRSALDDSILSGILSLHFRLVDKCKSFNSQQDLARNNVCSSIYKSCFCGRTVDERSPQCHCMHRLGLYTDFSTGAWSEKIKCRKLVRRERARHEEGR